MPTRLHLHSVLLTALSCLSFGLASSALAEVPTIRVASLQQMQRISAEASIEAVHQSTVAAQIPGRVFAVEADAGDAVQSGQLLLRIETGELDAAVATAAAGIARARSEHDHAQAELERARSLVENNFLSQSALDLALSHAQAAAAQLRAAQAQHAQNKVVQAHARVLAPLSGVIATRHIESGEMAQPGRPLFTLYNPSRMRAVADLAPQRLAELGDGPLRAMVELAASQRHIEASQVTILPAADASTHTVRVRVELPANTPDVLPGSFARIHFYAPASSGRLSIPAAAVLRRGELSAVYVLKPDGGFSLRQLRLGRSLADSEQIEVLAGLKGDETIALDPVRAGLGQPASAR